MKKFFQVFSHVTLTIYTNFLSPSNGRSTRNYLASICKAFSEKMLEYNGHRHEYSGQWQTVKIHRRSLFTVDVKHQTRPNKFDLAVE